MKKCRIGYIDVAKFMMISMVVFSHIENRATANGIESSIISYCDYIDRIWSPFYMPAFFVITGYCSNFDKDLSKQIWSCLKNILIPGIFLSIISAIFFSHNISGALIAVCEKLQNIPLYGCQYWFINALFIGKILYAICHKLTNDKKILCATMIAFFLMGGGKSEIKHTILVCHSNVYVSTLFGTGAAL